MFEKVIETLPRIRTKIQLTGLVVTIVGYILVQATNPEAPISAQLAVGSIGIVIIVFAQIFHFLKDFPENSRLTLVLSLFIIFILYSTGMFWLSISIVDDAGKSKALIELSNKNIEASYTSFLRETKKGNPKIVELFLKAGFLPDQQTPNADNALNIAAGSENPSVLKLFLDRSWLDVESNGTTPLVAAIKNNRLNNVKLLLESKADPNAGVNCKTPLREAIFNIDILSTLLAHGAKIDYSKQCSPLLVFAAYSTDKGTVSLLIRNGANVNTSDSNNTTPLMAASGNIFPRRDAKPDILKILIDSGAQVNFKDNNGSTALLFSVAAGSLDATKILLSSGADPNIPDGAGFTPLIVATQLKDRLKIMEELIHYQADPNMRTDHGDTALHFSVRTTRPFCTKVSLLINAGANPLITNNEGKLPLSNLPAIGQDIECDHLRGDIQANNIVQRMAGTSDALTGKFEWRHR